jgi:hypothetical protein
MSGVAHDVLVGRAMVIRASVNSSLLLAISAISLAACASSEGPVGPIIGGDDVPAPTSLDDGKGDVVTLELTPIEDEELDASFSVELVLARSQDEFVAYFHHAAPASIDFSRQWVAYYNPGGLWGGPYQSSIVGHVIDGRLELATTLTQPGASCPASDLPPEAHYLMVAFDRPSFQVDYDPFTHADLFEECEPEGPIGDPAADCATRTGGAFVTIEVAADAEERATVWVTDETFIVEAEGRVALRAENERRAAAGLELLPVVARVPLFEILAGRDCDGWKFHVDPADVMWDDTSIEIYDALPSYVHDNLREFLRPELKWSPWRTEVVSVDRRAEE